MDEGGPQKTISIRTLNHFAVWNLPILGLSSDNFRYMYREVLYCKVIKGSDGNGFLGAPLIHGLKAIHNVVITLS